MASLEQHKGFLTIDHTNSPGIPHDLAAEWSAKGIAVAEGSTKLEADTYCCSHCNAVVIKDPTRTRERAVCRKCMHVVCDRCVDNCMPFAKIAEHVMAGRQVKVDPKTKLILPV